MNRSTHSGFTLVELVAVIIIGGILAAVAVPRFANNSDFEDRFFYDEAIQGARYARQFAVSRGCYTRFNLTSSNFSLQRDSDCSSAAFSFTNNIVAPDDQASAYTKAGAPSGTGTGTIVFDPRGRAGSVSGTTFTPYSSTQTLAIGSRSLSVDGATGFVR